MEKKIKPKPVRKCAACNQHDEKAELLRIVRDMSGNAALDLTGKANGRGAYIHRSAACLAIAEKRGSLSRALKCKISESVWEKLKKEIVPNGE